MPVRIPAQGEILQNHNGRSIGELVQHIIQFGRQLVGDRTLPPRGSQHFNLETAVPVWQIEFRLERVWRGWNPGGIQGHCQ